MKNIFKKYDYKRLYLGYVSIPTNRLRMEVSPGVHTIKTICEPSILYQLDENWYLDLETGSTCLDESKIQEENSFTTVEVLKPLSKYYNFNTKKQDCFKFKALKIAKDNYSKYNLESWNEIAAKENLLACIKY